jgi:tetratricopeptide (TPR) repeat protein
MKEGERAIFSISSEYGYGEHGSGDKIPGGATLIFDIELLEILEDEDKYKTNAEAIAAAEELCATAAETFKAGDFTTTLASYRKALSIIKAKYGDDLNDITIRLQRNLSVTYAKLENWKKSLSFAEKVLSKEANDARALLRKTEASLRLGNLEEARKALDLGLVVTKNGAPFVGLKAAVEAAEKAERQRQTALFKKMVGK